MPKRPMKAALAEHIPMADHFKNCRFDMCEFIERLEVCGCRLVRGNSSLVY